MGASASVLITRIFLAARHPTMCCVAPLIPHAMYRSGAIRVPVWPIWSVCGRHPLLVTTREQPTAAAEQAGELLEPAEPLGAAHPTTAADDHLGLRERHLAGADLDSVRHANRDIGLSRARA